MLRRLSGSSKKRQVLLVINFLRRLKQKILPIKASVIFDSDEIEKQRQLQEAKKKVKLVVVKK